MFKKIFNYIAKSVYNKDGKISSSRVSSFFILGGILTSNLLFIIIDIVNAIHHWRLGKDYEIPAAHIGIFSLVLGHHLALLGINKLSERVGSKEEKAETNTEQPKEQQVQMINEDLSGLQKD